MDLPEAEQPTLIFRHDDDQVIGASLFDQRLELPRLVLKEAELENNIAAMSRYCADRGVSIAPHVKTTMAPAIIRRQLDAGVWGVTVATLSHLRQCLQLGAPRIILAHQLVNPAAARWLGTALAAALDQEVYCLVDSEAGVERLAHGLAAAGSTRRLPVLVELGVPGGRTGCRSPDELLAVARAAKSSEQLVLAGVEAFEGILGRGRSAEELQIVDHFLSEMASCARELDQAGLFDPEAEVILSAGGSLYFDRVAEVLSRAMPARPTRVILRSGCYVTHDHGEFYDPPAIPAADGGNSLLPALELWSEIVSVPEPNEAIAAFGRRDAPFDAGLPVVLGKVAGPDGPIAPCSYPRVTRLNDQHAYLDTSGGAPLRVGDRVICGIVHPCTAFDKWRSVLLVDRSYAVLEAIATVF